MSPSTSPASCYVLADRQQYRTGHIRVPDLEQRLAALMFGDMYYSFFQVAAEPRKAIALLTKLVYRGDSAVLTKVARGYSIWVEEPEAELVSGVEQSKLQISDQAASCLVLVNHYPHQGCHIQVPDMPQTMEAIRVDQRFYSTFKTGLSAAQALDILAKLLQRGDQSLLMADKSGYLIGIYEPDATYAAL